MRPVLWTVLLGGLLAYLAIAAIIWRRAAETLDNPPQRAADAALILGNRAYLRGKPNPCLTGRVDAGIALANAGRVKQLVLSGGVDKEDGRIEAEVMRQHARAEGYAGPLLLEPASTSTRLNLALSRPLLQAAGIRSVIVVSEPYHLWRVERLVRASRIRQGLRRAVRRCQHALLAALGHGFQGRIARAFGCREQCVQWLPPLRRPARAG